MTTLAITLLGVFALAVIAWQTWHEHVSSLRTISAEWTDPMIRIAVELESGQHRAARERAAQLCRRIERLPAGSQVGPQLRTRLASMMTKDPVYAAVVQEVRSASVSGLEVSEMSLCVKLRQLVIEDIRQCMFIAESLGQLKRRDAGGEAMVAARFHVSA